MTKNSPDDSDPWNTCSAMLRAPAARSVMSAGRHTSLNTVDSRNARLKNTEPPTKRQPACTRASAMP
jgi:hypothetical protein